MPGSLILTASQGAETMHLAESLPGMSQLSKRAARFYISEAPSHTTPRSCLLCKSGMHSLSRR